MKAAFVGLFCVLLMAGCGAWAQTVPDRPVESNPTIKRTPAKNPAENPTDPTQRPTLRRSPNEPEPVVAAPPDETNPALRDPDLPASRQVAYAVFSSTRMRLQTAKSAKDFQQTEQTFFDQMGRKGWVLVAAPNPSYPFYVFKRDAAR